MTVARAAIAAFPEEAKAHLLLGKLLLSARRYSEAEIPLREAIRLDPASPRGLRLLSWALLGAGRLEEAVHGFEAWLSLPLLGQDEEAKVTTVGAAIPAARQLADLLRDAHE